MPQLPNPDIDRKSPVPFYFQLAGLLEQEITQGRWRTNDRLPSEIQLCEHFDVSRTTVRQALARLEQEGLISRAKGRGSFVMESHRRTWLLHSVEGFFEGETERAGHAVSSRILRLTTGGLPRWAVDALGVASDAEGVTLERLRSVDGRIALYVVNYLPLRYADAVLSMSDPNESLYGRLRRITGVEVAGASRILEAVAVGERMGALLELTPSAPAVAVRSVSWDRQQRAFDCYEAWVRTDRLTIDIDVGTTPGPIASSLLGHVGGLSGSDGADGTAVLPVRSQHPPGDPPGEGAGRRPPRWRLATSENSMSNGGAVHSSFGTIDRTDEPLDPEAVPGARNPVEPPR